MSCSTPTCVRSRSARGKTLISIVALVAALSLLTWFLTWVFRSDSQRVKERVEDARDALVEGRDEEFLEFFDAELVYQPRPGQAPQGRPQKGLKDLERDLRRWREMSLAKVYILSDEVVIADGVATVTLIVAVGQGLLELGQVDVVLEAIRSEDGVWRVRSFGWTRRR